MMLAALLAAGCGGSGQPTSQSGTTAVHPSKAAAPSASSPSPHDALRSPFRSLDGYLRHRAGLITAAIYDAHTGSIWAYHTSQVQYTASIVKVEIMGTALWQAQRTGQGLPPAEASLMPSMIENSDNDSATQMLADVGGPSAVAQFDQAAGLTDTTPSTLALIPGTPWPGWGLTTTTALDEVRLMYRFAYPNTVLTGASRSYGLNLMEHIEADQDWGISGGLPAGSTVALKNGWLPLTVGWQINSIGWVSGGGRNYVLAVLTAHNPTEAYGIDTIEAIAQAVYRDLGPSGSG
jgi:beta-lactamase class A